MTDRLREALDEAGAVSAEWCEVHDSCRWLWEPDECETAALHRLVLNLSADPCSLVTRLLVDPEKLL